MFFYTLFFYTLFLVCKQLVEKDFHVLMGTRVLKNGANAIQQHFKQNNHSIEPLLLDVTDQKTIDNALKYVSNTFKQLDIL